MVQIDVRRRDRGMPKPGLHGHRIGPTCQPQTGSGMPEVVDAAAGCNGRPVHGAFDRRDVQLVAALGCEQQVVGALSVRAGTTSDSTRSATGIRRLFPDLVDFASTPSGAARLINSTGMGTRTKSRTRASRSSDHRRPAQEAISRMSANRWSRAETAM